MKHILSKIAIVAALAALPFATLDAKPGNSSNNNSSNNNSSNSSATLTLGRKPCDVLDVQVTGYLQQISGATWQPLNPAAPASACLGAYAGNDDVSQLGNNLGIENIGFLNNKQLFPEYGAFLGQDDLLDLDGDGAQDDPGWVFVGKIDFEASGPKYTTGTISKGSLSYTFSQVLALDCGNTDCRNATGGTWTYTPPVVTPQILLDILGANKFFDQAAVVFKAADQFAIYNFTLADLDLTPVLGNTPGNYAFRGTWEMKDTLINKGGNSATLSHVTLWLRDPYYKANGNGGDEPPQPSPVPGTLALLGAGLLGLSLVRRRRV